MEYPLRIVVRLRGALTEVELVPQFLLRTLDLLHTATVVYISTRVEDYRGKLTAASLSSPPSGLSSPASSLSPSSSEDSVQSKMSATAIIAMICLPSSSATANCLCASSESL